MKYLILIAVVLGVLWLLRSKRSGDDRKAASGQTQTKIPAPQDMVSCPVCSLHLPRADALAGADGKLYCSNEHRKRAGN